MSVAVRSPPTDLVGWARLQGIDAFVPAGPIASADIPSDHPFDVSPAVDFGRTEIRVPSLVLRPRSVDELRRILDRAVATQTPLITRGGGHSAGGQSLTWGVQVDLKRLAGAELRGPHVRAQGGCRWKSVIRACAPGGRRPAVLIGSQEPTVGGTLSVGGFGDRTPQAGLQIEQVEAMTVATLGGELHRVGPGDALFDYVLAGRGQLGVIVEVDFRTCPLPEVMDVRALHFPSLGSFLSTADGLLDTPLWDGMPAWWDITTGSVEALAGRAARAWEPSRVDVPAGGELHAAEEVERIPVLAALELDDRVGRAFASPCLEVVAALPDAQRLFRRLGAELLEMGLAPFLEEGVPLAVFRRNPALPLAPAPKHHDRAVIAAVRPEMPSSDAQRILPKLRRLADSLLREGACLYLMSVEGTEPRFLDRQFGEATARVFTTLKQRFDPEGLLNPWRPMQDALLRAREAGR